MNKCSYFLFLLFFSLRLIAGEKTVLISGASQGLGKATAKAFSEHGWNVWAGYRTTPGDLENVHWIYLDVTDEKIVKGVVQQILQEEGKIDLLVNNAAYGIIGLEEMVPVEEAKALFDVNFFGALRLIQEVVPFMQERRSGHIVNISGTSGIRALPGLGIHGASKFAIEGLSEALAVTLAPWNIHVVIVEPGTIKNDFARHANLISPPLDHPFESYPSSLMDRLTSLAEKGQEADEIGEIIVEIAEAETPNLRYQTSPSATNLAKKKFVDPTGNLLREEQSAFFESLIPLSVVAWLDGK